MHRSIDSTGPHDAIGEDLRAQIERACLDHPHLSATFKSLRDDLMHRAQHAPGQIVTVHADLTIDVTVGDRPMPLAAPIFLPAAVAAA